MCIEQESKLELYFICRYVRTQGVCACVSMNLKVLELLQLSSTDISVKTNDGVFLVDEKRITSPYW